MEIETAPPLEFSKLHCLWISIKNHVFHQQFAEFRTLDLRGTLHLPFKVIRDRFLANSFIHRLDDQVSSCMPAYTNNRLRTGQ